MQEAISKKNPTEIVMQRIAINTIFILFSNIYSLYLYPNFTENGILGTYFAP